VFGDLPRLGISAFLGTERAATARSSAVGTPTYVRAALPSQDTGHTQSSGSAVYAAAAPGIQAEDWAATVDSVFSSWGIDRHGDRR
jgi:hypothetical protein